MKKTLLKFIEIAEDLEIKYFLHLGTCLGLYRDGKFPPNDDIDVGVICDKNKLKKLFEKLKENKFREGGVFINPGNELNHHFWNGDVLLDIHFQFLQEELPFLEKLGKITVWEKEMFIPYPVQDFLDLEYNKIIGNRGGDWRIPSGVKSRPIKIENMIPDEVYKIDINEYYNFDGKRFEWKDTKNVKSNK